MKKYLRIGASVLVFTVCSAANASDWQPVSVSDSGISLWIDATSVRFSGARAKAWFMYDYPDDHKVEGTYPPKTARSSKELDLFDCDQGTSGTAQVVYTSGTNGVGEVVHNVSVPPAAVSYTDVIPDTLGESMLKYICAKRPRKKGSNM